MMHFLIAYVSKKEVANNLESISNLSGSENTSYPNVWGAAKAVAGGIAIAFNAYVRKEERSEVNDLRVNLKSLKKKVNKVGPEEVEGKK